MKIKFTKLPTTYGAIKVSLDGGQSFTEHNIADIHESGISLNDSQDYEKIQIRGPANLLKNLDIVSSVKVEGAEAGSTSELSFIMNTDTYGFAFPGCVTGIIIPNGITTIGGVNKIKPPQGSDYVSAFCLFPNLQTIVIPDSVTSIGSGAFSSCSSLTSITIPDSVTSIGDGAFQDCTNLANVTIPESVTTIGHYAFLGCSSLTSITIPEGVTSIGSSAFRNCSNLTSITIPSNVTSIEQYAFHGCSKLESIIIQEGVTSIEGWAFDDCSSLESIIIPDSVTSIGTYAFDGCKSLESITIPEGVTSIGSSAFRNCSNLKTINYEGTEEQWNAISKGNYWNSNCPSDMIINYNYQG